MQPAEQRATRHADVIIIGAGVLGTFHAYFAARKGLRTILVERNTYPSDASARNFGMVVQTIVETQGEWPAYARASRETYVTLQEEHDIGVRNTGSLYISSTENERRVLEEFASVHAQSLHCTYLDATEALYRYPLVRASYCSGALHFPDDLTLEPRRMLRTLIPFLTAQGMIDYVPQTTIVSVETSGRHCVVKDAMGNVFLADQVFVCCGADYRTLFPEHFSASGLKLCKLQMMQTEPQSHITLPHAILSGLSLRRYPAFNATASYAALLEEPVDEDIRHYGIHLLFKQAVDGSVIIGDSHEYSEFQAAHVTQEYTSCHINETILRYGQRMIELESWQLKTLWNGYYLIHPELNIYTESIDGMIHIVTGIAGKGMSTGPGFAQMNVDAKFP